MSDCLEDVHPQEVYFRNKEGMWLVCRVCGNMRKGAK